MKAIIQMVTLIGIDAMFVGLLVLLVLPLAKYKQAAFAVLKRNFIGYFGNLMGYLFLCIFVLASSIAAIWPPEFFSNNLANLDELSNWLPYIMLVFIPAITMSIWSEERRQGTDELLLTVPAGDFDIVLGKYLAVASIFTASLLFSHLANCAVLSSLSLGRLDTGLFVSTYFGYWLIGLAMLSLGMVASFLTSNLTVGFILGVLFNAPLVFAVNADVIVSDIDRAQTLSRWSASAQFDDLGRGVISLSSTAYFAMIVVVGLYFSMVLIGRRHWLGGRDGQSMLGHYLIRTSMLLVVAVGVNLLLTNHDFIRFDATSAKLSTLSSDSKDLIRAIESDPQIRIEAFISQSVPQPYVKTKHDLISKLKEIKAAGGGRIDVRIYDDLVPFSDEAALAEEQYDIKAETVTTRSRGALKQENIFLGAAFTRGLEKVVVPFFDHGIPIEYELIRSICTVAEAERKRIGVLRTDADLFGGFNMQTFQPRPRQLILEELEKQYEVVEVDPNSAIEQSFDVLLAVQPSSLTPPQLDNLIAVVERGQPTAIFEDPMPVAQGLRSAPGTSQPKRPRGGNPMFGGGGGAPPEPKGEISKLWELLGVEMVGEQSFGNFDAHVVWQDFNPYPKLRHFQPITREWVFVSPDAPDADDPLNGDQRITAGLEEVLFLYPGAVRSTGKEGLSFTPLAKTGESTGTIKVQDLMSSTNDPRQIRTSEGKSTREQFVLAARIRSDTKKDETAGDKKSASNSGDQEDKSSDAPAADGSKAPTEDLNKEGGAQQEDSDEDSKGSPISVVFVADIDLLSSDFMAVRARPEGEVDWKFENVTFVLNVLDDLANDARFMEIRKRQTRHGTLTMVDERTSAARERNQENMAKFEQLFKDKQDQARKEDEERVQKAQAKVNEITKRQQSGGGQGGQRAVLRELQEAMNQLGMQQNVQQRRQEADTQRLRRELERDLKQAERELELAISKVQKEYKILATVLPPIPPLVVGLVIFVGRRLREREGVSKARLRH